MVSDIAVSILETMLKKMESTGQSRSSILFDVDESLVNLVYDITEVQYSIEELRTGVSTCLAHEWVENVTIEDRFRNLRITTKGVGVAVSSRNKSTEVKEQSGLKKISRYIEERKGILTLLAALLGLITLYLNFFGDK